MGSVLELLLTTLYHGQLGRAGEIGRSLFFPGFASSPTIKIEKLYSEDAIIKNSDS